jgi:predicted transposase/invertase (TIGR01784 family)
MEKAAYSKEQLDTYDLWKINVMTERSALIDAKRVGKIEGKMERNIEIAKSMKCKGMAIEEISEITGLSQQQIEGLEF